MEHVKLYMLQIIQFVVISFIICYVVIHDIITNKRYLETDTSFVSTTIAKSKTVGTVNGLIFDSVDITYPSLEPSALFITTSVIITPNQTRDICTPPDGVRCTSNNDCPTPNSYAYDGAGAAYTGSCNISSNLCLVNAWCPMENYHHQQTIMDVGKGTVFLDIDAMFTSFNVMISNTHDINNTGAPVMGYNLFVIDEIVRNATNDSQNTNDVARRGMVILMAAEWQCNLDLDAKLCIPQFTYYRLDDEHDSIVHGFNVRNAWYQNDYKSRVLMKRYGVRIIFASFGSATKTSVIRLVSTICVGVATLMMSIVMVYYMFRCLKLSACSETKAKQLDTLSQEIDTGTMIEQSPSFVVEGKSMTLLGHANSTA